MYVSSLFKEIHIGLPTHHQIMTAVQSTYTSSVELVCITYENISNLTANHGSDRYSRTVG